MNPSAYVAGIGVLGPGIANWPQAAGILAGHVPFAHAPALLPHPDMLPAAERRRTGRLVKLALAVAAEAVAQADADAARLPSVFTSSGGDGQNSHELCVALAAAGREVSPTRFSNSVHNAAAGYWSIATGSNAASNVLCAHDASFTAGLIEALTQVAVDRQSLLLVAYDTDYPEPLRAKRPVPDAFGAALVLTPGEDSRSLARIEFTLAQQPPTGLGDAQLEALRTSVPAARSLPLLRQLARREPGAVVLEYLDPLHAVVMVAPCN